MQVKEKDIKTLNILFVVFIFGLFFTCAKAERGTWKFYAENSKGDIKYYYDEKSINHPSKDTVTVWVKRVFINTEELIQMREKLGLPTEGYENIDCTLTLKEIDCVHKMHRSLSFADYNKKGSILNSADLDPELSKFAYISPEMVIEELYKVVCPQKSR